MSTAGAQTEFVGRERELAELTAALDAALSGDGRLCLLVGEPGVGKTTLAARVCDEAERRGARVARGPCWDAGGAPAYWPWIQILRTLMRDESPESLRAALGQSARIPGLARAARLLLTPFGLGLVAGLTVMAVMLVRPESA
jgi:hypothetical protein